MTYDIDDGLPHAQNITMLKPPDLPEGFSGLDPAERAALQFEYAQGYIQAGWRLVLMAERSKGPNDKGWNEAHRLVDTEAKALERFSRGPCNMGVVHGASNTVALDFDHMEHASEILASWGIDAEKDLLTKGWRVWSREGRGKVIFRVPRGLALPFCKITWPARNPRHANDRVTILELRSGDVQDVLPGSIHPDTGEPYRWYPGQAPWECEADLPQEMRQWWSVLSDKQSGLADEVQNLCPWMPKRVGRAYFQRVRTRGSHSDAIGQYNQHNDVAELLESNGYKRKGKRWLAPSSSTGVPAVVRMGDKVYSHHASDVLADGHAHDAFDLLVLLEHGGDFEAALRDASQLLGIKREAAPMPDEIDIGACIAAQEGRKRKPATPTQRLAGLVAVPAAKPEPEVRRELYSEHLQRPPGFVGELVDWILRTSTQPQPMLAVAAALSLWGTALGHKVATPTDARTNLYLIGLAETGFGKDHARKCIKAALNEAGLLDLMGGEELASGPGMLSSLARGPVRLFAIDEFGRFVQSVGAKNAASHERSIVDVLLKAFSSASTIMLGTEYADQKTRARVDLHYPCASLYGTSVPRTFFDGLNSADVSGGFLNRFVVIETPSQPPEDVEAEPMSVPQRVVDMLRAARSITPGLEDNGSHPVSVRYGPMAKQALDEFRAELRARGIKLREHPDTAPLADLWSRAFEHAVKIGTVVCVGRELDPARLGGLGDTRHIELDVGSVRWSIDLVRETTMRMEGAVMGRTGDSDFDRLKNHVRSVLEQRAGERGLTIAQLSTNSRSFRGAEPRIRAAVLEALRQEGRAELRQLPRGNPPKDAPCWFPAARLDV